MSASETVERLREDDDIYPWWLGGDLWCKWCYAVCDWFGNPSDPADPRRVDVVVAHADTCPAIALDRALDALGGE